MRDLIQFVRQLWEDRLQSLEEFTKENNLSLEEALQMRNKELEGCMKDLESQTDALLEALEEADSLLASPRRDDEKLHRKLALGECLQRIGKQEEEAERAYDQEKVEFLRQARQLLIDSFQGDSPVLSVSSLVDEMPEAAMCADESSTPQDALLGFFQVPKVPTEEQDMQTDEAVLEETATQTKALIAKKIKALKKQTDQLAPKILRKSKSTSKSPKRSSRRSSPEQVTKKPKVKDSLLTPQYINVRLQIRAPSPRRHRLPWESGSEEGGDDGYTSTDLSPGVPPQPNNSAASLAQQSADNVGFETAEDTMTEQTSKKKKEKHKERTGSKSPKRAKGVGKSRSPKRAGESNDGGALQQPAAPTNVVVDMGQGEGGRPRRRRSKTQRSQMKSSGAAAVSSDEEEGERRRRTAEPHGDGGTPSLSRRRSPRTAGDGSPGRSERRTTVSAPGARTKSGLSPPQASQVYCLTALPQPGDLSAVAGAAAIAQSDSKLLHVEQELGAKQRVAQPRPARRRRCSGGGDTMSVQSFNSGEDGRGRGSQEVHSPRPARSAVQPPDELSLRGATGGQAAASPPRFQWETDYMLQQQDASLRSAAAPQGGEHNPWLYRMQQREQAPDMPPSEGSTDDTKRQPIGGEDSGFQSEVPPRSPAEAMYVPPLPLPLPTTSDASEAASPQPRPKSDTEIGLGTPRSPRSPSRGGVMATSPVRQVERSFSCEVPAKKQRCAESPAVAPSPVSQASGDQSSVVAEPRQSPRKSPRAQQSPAAAEAAVNQEGAPSPSASPSTSYTPHQSPCETTTDSSEYRDCAAQPAVGVTAVAASLSPVLAGSEATPATSTGPVSPATPAGQSSPQAAAAVGASPSLSSTGLLRKDYELLRTALTELKQLQTSFQRDFKANEQAQEASTRLQSDIQRMETSIQDLQDIVSQEYEQTRQDHEETRSSIEQIETRVEESERATQSQLNDLRARLEQITAKMTQLEGDVSREKSALTEVKATEGAAAPTVLTLSSMLTRLETEVITLRHEVDSNRHSLDSITSVTQLDSPKQSPSSGLHDQSNTSDWPETGHTDATQSSAPAGGGDTSGRQQQDQQQQPAAAAAAQQQEQQAEQRSRPDDLDSFKDSNSDLMSTAEEGNEDDLGQPEQQPASCQQQQDQQQQEQQRQRAVQTELPEQRRPAVAPLKIVGGRRSVSCCRRHQPEVLRQLRQMHLAPAPARPSQRSRSAAPPGSREGSEYDSPLQEYWAADLSTASASTEPPQLNESTRVHHGSSRNTSGHSEERRHKMEAFSSRRDGPADPSEKLDRLQHKLLSLRRRVLLSLYRRQRRRAVSEGPRGRREDPQQQRRRAQLAAIDRRLRHRIHGWNRRLLAEAGYQPAASSLSPGDVISDSSINSGELRRSSELASDSFSSPPAPAPAASSQRAASEYLHQLSRLLAGDTQREGRKIRGPSRGRHRERTVSPPTKDPSSSGRGPSRHRRPTAVHSPGVHMERFAQNESKLAELQEYLGGIRQHLQRMASELDSPPSQPSPAAARGARGVPATQAVVFRPWTRRHRSVSSQRPMVSLRY